MINLPAGFEGATFVAELFSAAAPFIGVSFLIAAGMLIVNILRNL